MPFAIQAVPGNKTKIDRARSSVAGRMDEEYSVRSTVTVPGHRQTPFHKLCIVAALTTAPVHNTAGGDTSRGHDVDPATVESTASGETASPVVRSTRL